MRFQTSQNHDLMKKIGFSFSYSRQMIFQKLPLKLSNVLQQRKGLRVKRAFFRRKNLAENFAGSLTVSSRLFVMMTTSILPKRYLQSDFIGAYLRVDNSYNHCIFINYVIIVYYCLCFCSSVEEKDSDAEGSETGSKRSSIRDKVSFFIFTIHVERTKTRLS